MTNDSNTTTLNSFSNSRTECNTNPTPETVIGLFGELDQWRTAVKINDQDDIFLIGRLVGKSPRTYELYYEPTSTSGKGIAGTISYHRFFSEEDDDYVTFEPVTDDDSDEPDNDSSEVRVQALSVSEHGRGEQLDAVLPLIRDALMDSDWVVDPADVDDLDLSRGMFLVSPEDIESPEEESWLPIRADTGYGEWQSAMLTLADFFTEAYDEPSFALSTQSILATKVMHGVARYPLDATRLVSHIDDVLADAGENPEAFRTLLLDYAVKNIPLDTVETPITEVSLDE